MLKHFSELSASLVYAILGKILQARRQSFLLIIHKKFIFRQLYSWMFFLYKGKKDEILNLKTRYEMGLGKLEFASSQVSVMQNQLTALRPQLLETSDETEKLMIKIEQDTIQVGGSFTLTFFILFLVNFLCLLILR